MRYYTQSELKMWRECKRKWWLHTYRKLRLRPEFTSVGAAQLGTLVHAGLETFYAGGDVAQLLEGARMSAPDDWAPEKVQKHLSSVEMAEIMISGYVEWLEESGADQYLELVSAEQKVTIDLTEDIGMMGRIDQVVRDTSTGALRFIDFKTVQNLTDIPKNAPRDEQFMHYSILLSGVDGLEKVDGGIWRMLRKVKRTARSNPPFYGEHSIKFNKHQLEAYKDRVTRIITEITSMEEMLDNGVAPKYIAIPTPSPTCDWKCEFKEVCPMFDNGDRVEDYIDAMYVSGNPLERYEEREEMSE